MMKDIKFHVMPGKFDKRAFFKHKLKVEISFPIKMKNIFTCLFSVKLKLGSSFYINESVIFRMVPDIKSLQ